MKCVNKDTKFYLGFLIMIVIGGLILLLIKSFGLLY